MLTPAYTHQGEVLIIATRLLKMDKGVLDVVHFFDLILSGGFTVMSWFSRNYIKNKPQKSVENMTTPWKNWKTATAVDNFQIWINLVLAFWNGIPQF